MERLDTNGLKFSAHRIALEFTGGINSITLYFVISCARSRKLARSAPITATLGKLSISKVNVEMRNAKSKYFHDKITDCSVMNDPQKTWKLINSLLGKNNKSNNLNELLVDSTSVSDPKSIVDAFNDYFISIGSSLAAEYVDESCSNVDNQPINYNINQSSDTFLKLSPISVDSVASTLRGLKHVKQQVLIKFLLKF